MPFLNFSLFNFFFVTFWNLCVAHPRVTSPRTGRPGVKAVVTANQRSHYGSSCVRVGRCPRGMASCKVIGRPTSFHAPIPQPPVEASRGVLRIVRSLSPPPPVRGSSTCYQVPGTAVALRYESLSFEIMVLLMVGLSYRL